MVCIGGWYSILFFCVACRRRLSIGRGYSYKSNRLRSWSTALLPSDEPVEGVGVENAFRTVASGGMEGIRLRVGRRRAFATSSKRSRRAVSSMSFLPCSNRASNSNSAGLRVAYRSTASRSSVKRLGPTVRLVTFLPCEYNMVVGNFFTPNDLHRAVLAPHSTAAKRTEWATPSLSTPPPC